MWVVAASELIRVGGDEEKLSILDRFPIPQGDHRFAWCDGQGRVWLTERLKNNRGTKLIRFATSDSGRVAGVER